jgi:membrane protease subunit HflK
MPWKQGPFQGPGYRPEPATALGNGNGNDGMSPWGRPGGTPGGGSAGGSGGNSGGGDGGRPPPGGPGGRRPSGGGGGGGGGPRNPFGGGNQPDIDAIIARFQERVRRLLPGTGGGGRGIALVVIALVAVWLGSGFYRVQPDEQGIVLRFGAYTRSTLPGLNYHLPWPIESVERPQVTHINRIEIGYRSGAGEVRVQTGRDQSGQDVLEESLMLTGDENIVDIDVAVFWRIRDPVAFLFNVRTPANNPSAVVKAVAESAMREVIGRTPIQPALTEARAQIEQDVLKETQTILDAYKAGVEITQVQLQKVDPPAAVIDSFRDVQRANTDADRLRNEAQSYRNDIVPKARGEAARITAEADAQRQASVAEATGQTERFLQVFAAYQAAKEITLRRMYIETMQDLLQHAPAVIVDGNLKGIVPFLPLGPGTPGASPTAPAPGRSAAQ